MYYSSFIHSSIVGHLSHFQVLAVMNKAALGIHVYIFVWTCMYLEVWWLDCLVNLWQLYKIKCQTALKVAIPSCLPTKNEWELLLLHILWHLTVLVFWILAILIGVSRYFWQYQCLWTVSMAIWLREKSASRKWPAYTQSPSDTWSPELNAVCMHQPSLKPSSFHWAFSEPWEEMFVHLINLLGIVCITQELLNFLFG